MSNDSIENLWLPCQLYVFSHIALQLDGRLREPLVSVFVRIKGELKAAFSIFSYRQTMARMPQTLL